MCRLKYSMPFCCLSQAVAYDLGGILATRRSFQSLEQVVPRFFYLPVQHFEAASNGEIVLSPARFRG
jgi:hypothetical protein